ncbi:MAG TPA: cell division protein FtsZ [Cyclobacteriaceae bacterium]|nr:cell division protein FtsZ [Cyclobacteriaceae bacterium]
MSSYIFDIPVHHKSIIKVIGVGGGGSNAVTHMFNLGIRGVEFVVCNTDLQALHSSPIPNKLQLGANLTEGLGAGANPEVGKNAAIESKESIRELLSDKTKMVFITAGMGGGTGTGAAPIIARIAKDLEILTVGIVTAPFKFEGAKKAGVAETGINELKMCCDTVLVIENEKLREIYGNLAVTKAFAEADNVLLTAAKGIAEIITVSGYVNVDFEDVKTVMKNSGAAVMGSAVAMGDQRARTAAEAAITSPLLNNTNIHGAKKILLSITSGDKAELQMDELSMITDYIQERTGAEAEIIFGHGVDPDLGENIKVTVIATGFGESQKSSREPKRKVYDLERNSQATLFEENAKKPKAKKADEMVIIQKKEEPKPIPLTIEPPVIEEVKAPDPVKLELKGEYELEEAAPVKEMSKADEPIQDNSSIDEKKHFLMEQARVRSEKLHGGKNTGLSDEEFRERWETPAYLRKNVKLQDVPHSSEHDISRYNLNDDNAILGNNKFLHDNVD